MLKKIIISLFLILATSAYSFDGDYILQKIDSYRGSYKHSKFKLDIQNYKGDTLYETKSYLVYSSNKNSLVIMQSGGGQRKPCVIDTKGYVPIG